jgi:multidrug resistance efflux pump
MIRQHLLTIFWLGVIVLLVLFSLVFKDTNTAIVAQVEPMKKAVSYHKAIKVLEIYVIPGQRVAPGDLLVKVERPDLLLDVERKKNDLEQLRIERIVLQKKYEERKKQLDIEKEFKIQKLNAETEQLIITVENNRRISSQFGSLAGYSDSTAAQDKSYYEIELNALTKERNFVINHHAQVSAANTMIYQEELKLLQVLEGEREKELRSLMEEEDQLIRRSEIHGTIGSLSAQSGELLSPYSTILSIYELNPTVIKAIMNEGYRYDLKVGQVVKVESTNRLYKTEGVISEIGSRIIEYPDRLRTNQNIPMWGRELFIKIPEQNNFLNGERVIVSLKKSRL